MIETTSRTINISGKDYEGNIKIIKLRNEVLLEIHGKYKHRNKCNVKNLGLYLQSIGQDILQGLLSGNLSE